MAQKLTASMPEALDLAFTYAVQFAALDPTTGADVPGVVISGALLTVTQLTPDTAPDDLNSGFFSVAFRGQPLGTLNSEGSG